MPLPDGFDFTRIAWVSNEAQDLWWPRMQAASQAFAEIELLTVKEGVRRMTRTAVAAQDLPEWCAKVRRLGLQPVPRQAIAGSSTYSNSANAPEPGGPVSFMVAAVRPGDEEAAYSAEHGAQEGELLGYPECCRVFFDEVWGRDRDTTWSMAMPGARRRRPRYKPDEPRGRKVDITEFYKASILLRWFGVRLVPHLPCTFDCDPSHRLAETFEAVGRQHGFGEEMDLILEMLAWPVRYSVLHGIAEIVTPVAKAISRSMDAPQKLTVNLHGKGYPVHGASGVKFPFRPAGAAPVPEQPLNRAPVHWELNGFASLSAMRVAHDVVVDASASCNLQGIPIIDLGCGNGELLRRLRQKHPGGKIIGVDTNLDALNDAVDRQKKLKAAWWHKDMFDPELGELPSTGVVVVMPGRFIEALEQGNVAADLRRQLDGRTLIVYAYGDWLVRAHRDGLGGLCRAAGLLSTSWHGFQTAPGVAAAVIAGVRASLPEEATA